MSPGAVTWQTTKSMMCSGVWADVNQNNGKIVEFIRTVNETKSTKETVMSSLPLRLESTAASWFVIEHSHVKYP